MDPIEMHAAYVRERTGAAVEIDPGKGFATWQALFPLPGVSKSFEVQSFQGPREVYIVDIYVAPEYRQNGVAAGLADRITAEATKLGATRLIGSVDTRSLTRTEALKALLAYGFSLDRIEGAMLWLSKEIG